MILFFTGLACINTTIFWLENSSTKALLNFFIPVRSRIAKKQHYQDLDIFHPAIHRPAWKALSHTIIREILQKSGDIVHIFRETHVKGVDFSTNIKGQLKGMATLRLLELSRRASRLQQAQAMVSYELQKNEL